MKKLFSVAGIFLLVCILTGCTRTKIQYWENGNKKSEMAYRNGKLQGVATWYYQDGKKHYEVTYKDDLLEGKAIRWYSNGKVQSEDYYSGNMLNGSSIDWGIDGSMIEMRTYRNDTLHGPFRRLYANRQLQIEGTYNNGLYDGKWLYWDTYGNIVGEGNYKDGAGIQKGWGPDGKLIRKISYMDNRKHGKEIIYNSEGDVEKEILYEYGEVVDVNEF